MADDLDRAGRRIGHKNDILDDSADSSDRNSAAARAFGQLANALTLTRFAMAAGWIWLFHTVDGGGSGPAIGISIAAAVTDFLDGRVARGMGAAGGTGGWLDPVADVVFVLAALGCFAAAGAIPIYIPVLIAISFGQYAIDSILIAPGRGPMRSVLGHYGGVINYALAIAMSVSSPATSARAALRAIMPAVAAYYVAAMGERAMRYRLR